MIGAQIGTYRVLRQLGEGGMGSVWLAEHAVLRKKVAIKVLHREMSQRQELVARFFNEARAATEISDPGIVQVFDFGKHSDGNAYIVMELLEGEALDRRLHRMKILPLAAALRICRQVAATLGAAHARGIVHRDIKPDNIFMVRDPEVFGGERTKVLDFGIAKMALDTRVKTQTSALLGTPTFMSPEQCRGAGQVDQRSDVYSLGCVLFTLLTGRPLFDGEGAGDVIAMHLREPPPAPSSVMPGIPAAVDNLVLRCLSKDRAQRFSSGTELAAGIEEVLRDPTVQPLLVESSASLMPAASSIVSLPDLPTQRAEPISPATTMVVDPRSVPSLPEQAEQVEATVSSAGVVSGEIQARRLTAAATTLSISARGGLRERRSLRRWGLGAIVVSVPAAVSLAVLASRSGGEDSGPGDRSDTASPSAQAGEVESAPAPSGATGLAPAASGAPSGPPASAVDEAMSFVLRAYEGWSKLQRQPAGKPCPQVTSILAGQRNPPPLVEQIELVCDVSPQGRRVGAVWKGVDGVRGTRDDVSSWDRPADRVRPVAVASGAPVVAAPLRTTPGKILSPKKTAQQDEPTTRPETDDPTDEAMLDEPAEAAASPESPAAAPQAEPEPEPAPASAAAENPEFVDANGDGIPDVR